MTSRVSFPSAAYATIPDTIDSVATGSQGLTATSTTNLFLDPYCSSTFGTPRAHIRASSVLSVGCPKAATYRSPRFLYYLGHLAE
jgi:hypothetical protein